LYSDLGHCGKWNIRYSWIFVKSCLILNYLDRARGCWLIMKTNTLMYQWAACFYGVMPEWFRLVGITIATAAAIIASQALISGSFTLVSEAIASKPLAQNAHQLPNRRKRTTLYSRCKLLLFFGCSV